MRHSVILKFIALFLCAASLLAMIASAGAMFVLTEAGLYNRTVDQMRQEQFQLEGQHFARNQALRFASKTYGGCSEELVDEIYGDNWFPEAYTTGDHGAAILDKEGNVLERKGAEPTADAVLYSFTVSGNYMHLVSETPVEEESHRKPDSAVPSADTIDIYDAILENGGMVPIYEYVAHYDHGSIDALPHGESYGNLFLDHQGRAVFQSTKPDELTTSVSIDLNYISFAGADGSLVYEASSPSGSAVVGAISYDGNGYYTFVAASASAENIPSIPQSFSRMEIYDAGGIRLVAISNQQDIGYMEYDNRGYLSAHLYSLSASNVEFANGTFSTPMTASRIVLYDVSNAVMQDYSAPGYVTHTPDGDGLYYVSAYPAILPEDAVVLPAEAAVLPAGASAPEVTAAPETAPAEAPQETEVIAPEEAAAEEPAEEPAEAEAEPQTEEIPDEEVPQDDEPQEEASNEEEAAPEEHAEEEPQEEETSGEASEETAPPETVAPTVPETLPPETVPETVPETQPEPTEPLLINGKPLYEYGLNSYTYYHPTLQQKVKAEYVYVPMEEYTVEVYLAQGMNRNQVVYEILTILRNFRNDLFLFLGIGLLVFAISGVYLCWSAGHQGKGLPIQAQGLNRMPLDLYLILGGTTVGVIIALVLEGGDLGMLENSPEVYLPLAAGSGFLCCLVAVGFLFAIVAQCKTPRAYWLRNTLCVRILSGCIKAAAWLGRWSAQNLRRILISIWKFSAGIVLSIYFFFEKLWKKFCAWFCKILRRYFSLLPLTWQWMVTGAVLVLVLIFALAERSEGTFILSILIGIGLVLYGSHCFGILMEGAKHMSKGDLDSKVEDKYMVGAFQEFAGDLNALADVAVVAAQKQLKSERMKTELITNVSHDIKTPLTSIINYVDLLQKPHTEEEGQEYLEVLDRQSQRLKKLIEDLMEMSKASTGNLTVDIIELDAIESVNQALGEFADKLEKAQLYPVFRHDLKEAPIRADGKLVWRVLSNVLGNAVKYAMPGTRLYIDLMELEGKIVISIKNISRDELNMDADELMERFVRGDDSRNTEGSGLGLNIARSLMELQKGQLQLLVDGDLFKVTLIFPGV